MTISSALISLLALVEVLVGIYAAKGQPVPGSFQILYVMALLWGIGMWLEDDNKRYRIDWVFDMGMLLYVAWPLVMPIYLFKTRGLKAYRPILLFVCAYVFGFYVGYLVGAVL